MANTKISELQIATQLNSDDIFVIVQNDITKQITGETFFNLENLFDVNIDSPKDRDRIVYSGGTWKNIPFESSDNRYVNATGDTMTGDLEIDADLYVLNTSELNQIITTGITFKNATGETLKINSILSNNSGDNNNINSTYSSILGGQSNSISTNSNYSLIGTGQANNITNSEYSFISAGKDNEIENSDYSFIGGGQGLRIIENEYASVFGNYNYSGRTLGDDVLFVVGNGTGDSETDRSDAFIVTSGNSSIYMNSDVYINSNVNMNYDKVLNISSINSPTSNLNSANYNYILGYDNTIGNSDYSSILGGYSNSLVGNYNSITGGENNNINISFGDINHISITGGKNNEIYSDGDLDSDSILGGISNKINHHGGGGCNIILGGKNNELSLKSIDDFTGLTYQCNFIGGGNNNTIIQPEYINASQGDETFYNSILGGSDNTIEYCRNSSIIGGKGLLIEEDYCVGIGLYNNSASGITDDSSVTDTLFVVGNGTGDADRSDAFVIKSTASGNATNLYLLSGETLKQVLIDSTDGKLYIE